MTRSAGSSTASRRNFRNDHFLELANSGSRSAGNGPMLCSRNTIWLTPHPQPPQPPSARSWPPIVVASRLETDVSTGSPVRSAVSYISSVRFDISIGEAHLLSRPGTTTSRVPTVLPSTRASASVTAPLSSEEEADPQAAAFPRKVTSGAPPAGVGRTAEGPTGESISVPHPVADSSTIAIPYHARPFIAAEVRLRISDALPFVSGLKDRISCNSFTFTGFSRQFTSPASCSKTPRLRIAPRRLPSQSPSSRHPNNLPITCIESVPGRQLRPRFGPWARLAESSPIISLDVGESKTEQPSPPR